MSKRAQFYNFPICLLSGFMNYSDRCLKDILAFVTWKHNGGNMSEQETSEYLGVKYPNFAKTLKQGKEIEDNLVWQNKSSPWTGLNRDVFWQFKEGSCSDFNNVVLLAFLAFKSILGNKPWYKITNQNQIYYRMAGKTMGKGKHPKLPQEIAAFCTRYKFDQIKLELKENWGLLIYANHTRGMYVSTIDKMSLEELALVAERGKLQRRKLAQRQAEQEAKEAAIRALKSG